MRRSRLENHVGEKERRDSNDQLQVFVWRHLSNINCKMLSVEIELNQIKALDGQKRGIPQKNNINEVLGVVIMGKMVKHRHSSFIDTDLDKYLPKNKQ